MVHHFAESFGAVGPRRFRMVRLPYALGVAASTVPRWCREESVESGRGRALPTGYRIDRSCWRQIAVARGRDLVRKVVGAGGEVQAAVRSDGGRIVVGSALPQCQQRDGEFAGGGDDGALLGGLATARGDAFAGFAQA